MCISTCTSSGQAIACMIHLCERKVSVLAAHTNGATWALAGRSQGTVPLSPPLHRSSKLEKLGNSCLAHRCIWLSNMPPFMIMLNYVLRCIYRYKNNIALGGKLLSMNFWLKLVEMQTKEIRNQLISNRGRARTAFKSSSLFLRGKIAHFSKVPKIDAVWCCRKNRRG